MVGEVLSLPEAAFALRVSKDTVRRMIKSGQLPAFKVRGVWRVKREELERIMQSVTSQCSEH